MDREMGLGVRAIEALPDACGDDYQLKRMKSRWFHAPGSVSPRA